MPGATSSHATSVENQGAMLSERYRMLLETSPDAISVYDPEGRLRAGNPRAARLHGFEGPAQLENISFLDLVHPEDRSRAREDMRRALKKGALLAAEYSMVRGDGSHFPGEVSISTMVDSQGECQGLILVTRDVTERKQAAEQMRAQRDLALSIAAASTLLEALPLCLDTAIQVSGMDCGGIYLLDPTSNDFDLACYQGFRVEEVKGMRRLPAGSERWNMVMEGKAIFSRHQDRGLLLSGLPGEEKVRALAVIPVRHRARVIACFSLGSHRLERAPRPTRVALEMIAAQVGNVIAKLQTEAALLKAHADLEQRVKERTAELSKANAILENDVAERRRMETAIQQYAERLRALHEIDRGILAAQSSQAIAEAALRDIKRLVPGQRVTVVEFLASSDEARLLAVDVDAPTVFGTGTFLPLPSFRLDLLEAGAVQAVEDLTAEATDTDWHRALIAEGIRCYINVPLRVEKELIGCLHLGANQVGFFVPEHLAIATEIATSLAVAIRNARLREQIRRDGETKAMLVHEINHRVKNNLSAIIGLLFSVKRNVQLKSELNPASIIDDLIGRIQGLAATHRLLSATEWSPVPLGQLVEQIIQACVHALSPNKRVAVTVSPCAVQVPPRLANSLALIVSELTTNTIKYAIKERAMARIQASITYANGMVVFEYSDDGPGFPEDVLRMQRHNVGLHLIQAIARNDLQAALTLHNEGGAMTRLRFKLEPRIELLHESAA